MTTWNDLSVISENLVQTFFGSYTALSVAVFFALFITYLWYGVPFDITLSTLLPLFVVFAGAGWLGANQWIVGFGAIMLARVATPFLRQAFAGR